MVDRALGALLRPHARALALPSGLLGLVSGSYAVQAVFLAHALAAVAQGRAGDIGPAVAGVAGVALARLGLSRAQTAAAQRLGWRVRSAIRTSALRAALQRRTDPDDRDGTVRLAITEGADGLDVYASRYLPALAQVVLVCPVLLLAVGVIAPWLALALTMCVVLALLVPRWWDRLLRARGTEHWDTYESLSADYLEALQGMGTLRALGDVANTRDRLRMRSDALHRATVRTMRVSLVDTALVDLAVQAGQVLAAGLAVIAATTEGPSRLDAPATYLVLLLAAEVLRPVRELARQWHAGFLGTTAAGPLHRLIGSGAEPTDPRCPAPVGAVVVEDVRFGHSGGPIVLTGASARFPAGSVTAVVGDSGVGKSTLLDLLAGIHSPDAGRIVDADGHRVGAEHIAAVSQHTYLFDGTVEENVLVARPDAGSDDVAAALRDAGLTGDLAGMRDGGATRVGEGGAHLSGGQRQRVSLARALLSARPVLLMDEPTSALDDERADEVMAAVRRYVRRVPSRLAVVVTHREEVLDHADAVLHLSAGQLHETDPSTMRRIDSRTEAS